MQKQERILVSTVISVVKVIDGVNPIDQLGFWSWTTLEYPYVLCGLSMFIMVPPSYLLLISPYGMGWIREKNPPVSFPWFFVVPRRSMCYTLDSDAMQLLSWNLGVGWISLGANNYPVVNGGSDLELWVFIFPIKSIKWGAIWSYQEFPNHTLDNIQIFWYLPEVFWSYSLVDWLKRETGLVGPTRDVIWDV